MSDIERYERLRSSWSSADEAFNWLVDAVATHNNGEAVDNYCMFLAARDMICSTLVEVGGWAEPKAIDFVSAEGSLTAEINEDEDLGKHLLLAWQPVGMEEAEIFVYALDIHGGTDQDA